MSNYVADMLLQAMLHRTSEIHLEVLWKHKVKTILTHELM